MTTIIRFGAETAVVKPQMVKVPPLVVDDVDPEIPEEAKKS